MEKIFDLGVETYVAATPPKPLSIYDHLVSFGSTLFDIGKFCLFSIPYWIEAFVFLFVPHTKKNVAGQVVLVDDLLFFCWCYFIVINPYYCEYVCLMYF